MYPHIETSDFHTIATHLETLEDINKKFNAIIDELSGHRHANDAKIQKDAGDFEVAYAKLKIKFKQRLDVLKPALKAESEVASDPDQGFRWFARELAAVSRHVRVIDQQECKPVVDGEVSLPDEFSEASSWSTQRASGLRAL